MSAGQKAGKQTKHSSHLLAVHTSEEPGSKYCCKIVAYFTDF